MSLLRLVPSPWTFQLSCHVTLRKLHDLRSPWFAVCAKPPPRAIGSQRYSGSKAWPTAWCIIIFPDRAEHTLIHDWDGVGASFCSPREGPDSLLSRYHKNLQQPSPRWGMCVWRQPRKARERLTAFFPLPPFSVGDTGEKRAADPGLNLECSLIRYYAICSHALSSSNAAANLLSGPN